MADNSQTPDSNPRIGPTTIAVAFAIVAVPVAMMWHILKAPDKKVVKR